MHIIFGSTVLYYLYLVGKSFFPYLRKKQTHMYLFSSCETFWSIGFGWIRTSCRPKCSFFHKLQVHLGFLRATSSILNLTVKALPQTLMYMVLINLIKWDWYFHVHVTDTEFNNSELHGLMTGTRPSNFIFCLSWCFAGVLLASPRASQFLETAKSSGPRAYLSYANQPNLSL